MCGGAVGSATVNGPQGSFKVKENGTFNLLESRWSSNNLHVEGTFDNNELRNVKMTVGGGLGQPGDMIEFRNDGKLLLNGQEVNGEVTTANGTKISKNGDQVVIKTPDGDSFKMYISFCQPPAINMEGEIAPNRAQGDVAGLVGTFDDSIPEGQFPEGLGGTRNGDPSTKAFWASWAVKQLSEASDEDDKRRKEAAAAAEKAAQKSADAEAQDAKAGDGKPADPADPAKPAAPAEPGAGPATGGPTPGAPVTVGSAPAAAGK
ncbi:MAG: hypothetical protein FJZ01_15700 [Candidatus Sericytochromatia bacterium]|nr:hypothetical protein [Candidatus Tanganyikabacteria bacterium]